MTFEEFTVQRELPIDRDDSDKARVAAFASGVARNIFV